MSSEEQQVQSTLIDLTDVEDDGIIPESLKNIVADMDYLLQNEHKNFMSVASRDPVVDDTPMMSPDKTPGLNPAANIQQARSSDIFTPKPSLFAQPESALIDFAATDFTSPPSYERSMALADPSHSQPAPASLPPRPPPTLPKALRVASPAPSPLVQVEPSVDPKTNPFASIDLLNGYMESAKPHVESVPEAKDPFAPSSSLQDPPKMMRPEAPRFEASNLLSPTVPSVVAPMEFPNTETPQKETQQVPSTENLMQGNQAVATTKNHQNLETLLANDAVKYDLPPPTPASTVTGPKPLETPPRVQPVNTYSDTPSPLSMSSVTKEPPKEELKQTPTAKESPPPPRFSPSPIENTSDRKFTQETANRLSMSNGSGNSSRSQALAKTIASAKKAPDKPKGLAQRLFTSVVSRVAPAPVDTTQHAGELKTKPAQSHSQPTQSLSNAKANGNIGELNVKPSQVKLKTAPAQPNNRAQSSKKDVSPTAVPVGSNSTKEMKESPKSRTPKEVVDDVAKASEPKQPRGMATAKRLDSPHSHHTPSTGHFMTETVVSAAAKLNTTEEHEHHHHQIKPLESTSHLLQPTTATAARNRRQDSKAEESVHQKTVSPEKVRPLAATSHLLQSTTAMDARKIHVTEPPQPRSSPQRVKKLSSTSHLLAPTAAARARKTERKERPMPPAAPPRRVIMGASDRLLKPTNSSKSKVEEGVAKARERIRQRKLQELGIPLPMTRNHSVDSSRASSSSKRSLTIPKSPKFSSSSRHHANQDDKKEALHNSLADCDSLFGKSLRSSDAPSVGTSSTSRRPKDLTIPISPRFTTDARRGSKPKPIINKSTDFTLAHSTKVLQQSLRSATIPPPSRKKGLTHGVSPKFSTITRRAPPKSTEERELEEMKKFQKTPFRARPYPGFTDRPRAGTSATTPSFMKPTQGQIARTTAKKDGSFSSNGPFRARPAPLSTFRAPNIKPSKHSPTTEAKPFALQTSARTIGGRHTAMTEAARKRNEERILERQAKNERKEADEVEAIRRKHAAELRREQVKRNRRVAKLSPHNIPTENKKRTNPQPFQLASAPRHESAREEMMRKQAEEEELRRKQASFRAKPVPKSTYKVRPLGTSPTDASPRHQNEENHS